jgi:hypothetical protein
MSRVAAIKNAFRPRPPGPVRRFTPTEVFEEAKTMGMPTSQENVRAAAERWIMEHPRQAITAKEIRSALGLDRKMTYVRTVGEALRRLCRQGRAKGTWTYRPDARQRGAPAPDLFLADIVISVSIRPRAGAVVGPGPGGKQRSR